MPRFQHRSAQQELLDQPAIPFADIRQNMRELDTINTLLGGHRITLHGLRQLTAGWPRNTPLKVLEIGCGDGNNLRVIAGWARRRGMALELTGIDYNEACIDYARQIDANKGIEFICSDYRTARLNSRPHVIFSSLFCHHFSDTDLVQQLQWMHQQASLGFFINDLHRNPFAYYSIKALTQIFSKSYLVKNDAPLSVLRGFSSKEWAALLRRADVSADLKWMWAFRWLILFRHQQAQLRQQQAALAIGTPAGCEV